jgi:hypothetical protein
MDAFPEKVHHVSLPGLPHLHMPDLPHPRMPQLPRLRMPKLSLLAATWSGIEGRLTGRGAVETHMDASAEKFYYIPLPQLPRLHMPDRPFSAAIDRGLRGCATAAESWRRGCHTRQRRKS